MGNPVEIMTRTLGGACGNVSGDREAVGLIIAALDAAGFAIVPKEPTVEMIAAYSAVPAAQHIKDGEPRTVTEFRAMVEAGAVKP